MIQLSIIIPTYERHSKVKLLLERLIPRLDLGTEVIIIDDSKESLTDYISQLNCCQIQYIYQLERTGVSEKRNQGAVLSNGIYLIFLDDDDGFTEDWLSDFNQLIAEKADLIYCGMQAAFKREKSIIPGSWMIKKAIFEKVGGFDKRLKFAENTELFIRLEQLNLVEGHIQKANFIYNQSPDGGSKNLQNMSDSIQIILDKHPTLLTKHVKYLYYQILGVNQMRFQDFGAARKNLLKAWTYKPHRISTLGRLGIAIIPVLAKIFYPPIPKRS